METTSTIDFTSDKGSLTEQDHLLKQDIDRFTFHLFEGEEKKKKLERPPLKKICRSSQVRALRLWLRLQKPHAATRTSLKNLETELKFID